MLVREFMTPNPHGIQAHDSARHAAEQMRRHGVGALPVFDHERLVGMITDRDIATGCVAAGHDSAACHVVQHMTADPVAVSEEASVEDALRVMAAEQVRRLAVMNGDRLVGIVALGDLAVRHPTHPEIARTLAEISEPIHVPLEV